MAPITTKYAPLYISPNGPGDARPTALQIIQDEGLVGKLVGKVFLITGANDTTGLEIARALHMTGAKIFITTRSEEKNKKSIEDIISTNGIKGGIEGIVMELGDLASVRRAAGEFLGRSERLDGLICNAGTFPSTHVLTKDGFEQCLGVNHLGHFLLFNLLTSAMLSSSTPTSSSRLIMVSSIGHRGSDFNFQDPNFQSRPWDRVSAYAQSKTANIYTALYAEKLYGKKGIHAWSLQPGGIDSNLWIDDEETRKVVLGHERLGRYLMNTKQGAAMAVWAAVGRELEGKGGKYLEGLQEIGLWKGDEETRLDWTYPGHESWIYDEEKAERLWRLSEEMISEK